MTKIEQAIAFIAKKGNARTPEIAEHLGVDYKNVAPLLWDVANSGFLVCCKIERPGSPPMNEYRLSATVAENNVSWRDFKVSRRKDRDHQPKESKHAGIPVFRAPVASAKPASQPVQEKQEQGAVSVVVCNQAAPAAMAPKIEAFDFWLDRSGKMVISTEEGEIELSPDRVRELGHFMVDTESAWS